MRTGSFKQHTHVLPEETNMETAQVRVASNVLNLYLEGTRYISGLVSGYTDGGFVVLLKAPQKNTG